MDEPTFGYCDPYLVVDFESSSTFDISQNISRYKKFPKSWISKGSQFGEKTFISFENELYVQETVIEFS